MKPLFSFLAFQLFSVCLLAQTMNVTVANVGNLVKAAAGGGATYLVQENFEGSNSGYDLTGWTGVNTPDPDYTTVHLEGAESLRVSSYGGAWNSFTSDGATNFAYCLVRLVGVPVNPQTSILSLRDASGVMTCQIRGSSATADTQIALRVLSGAADHSTTLLLDTNVTYHCWFSHSTTGWYEIAFSTDGTKPTTGLYYLNTDGSTEQDGRVYFVVDDVWGYGVIWDKLRISKIGPIGNSPD